MLRLRCRETEENEIQSEKGGTITFKDNNMASFTAKGLSSLHRQRGAFYRTNGL